jgi:hypothetical protein
MTSKNTWQATLLLIGVACFLLISGVGFDFLEKGGLKKRVAWGQEEAGDDQKPREEFGVTEGEIGKGELTGEREDEGAEDRAEETKEESGDSKVKDAEMEEEKEGNNEQEEDLSEDEKEGEERGEPQPESREGGGEKDNAREEEREEIGKASGSPEEEGAEEKGEDLENEEGNKEASKDKEGDEGRGEEFLDKEGDKQKEERYPLLINEVRIGDEESSKHDWVEIHNYSQEEVILEGCALKKLTASGKDYNLKSFGKSHKIEPGGYFLWANSRDGFAEGLGAQVSTTATLSDKNCAILLCETEKEKGGGFEREQLIDGICWGGIDNFSEEAQEKLLTKEAFFEVSPKEKQSLARISGRKNQDQKDLFLKSGDFECTSDPTPRAENKFPKSAPSQEHLRAIYISEVLSNPEGKDENQERVELFNASTSKTISLVGWELENGRDKKFDLSELELEPEAFGVVKIVDTSMTIRNTDEVLRLLDPNGDLVDEIILPGSAKSGISYGREFDLSRVDSEKLLGDSGEYQEFPMEGLVTRDLIVKEDWSYFQTFGGVNRLNKLPRFKVRKPEGVYQKIYAHFDATDSIDPDGDQLKFRWDFGDGHRSYLASPRHKYDKKGTYQVTLRLDDGRAEVFESFQLKVREFPKYELRIVGLLANPKGKDSEGEVIIIKNESKKDLNLKGYKIATGKNEDTLTNHPIYKDFEIEAGEEKELQRGEICKFSLLNKAGVVDLRYPDEEVADKISYQKENEETIEEGEWYVWKDDAWVWQGGETEYVSEENSVALGIATVADFKEAKEVRGRKLEKREVEREWNLALLYYRENSGECLSLEGLVREEWLFSHSYWFFFLPSQGGRVAWRE